MGASVGVGGLIVGTSMLVVLALAVNAIDLRMETSLETIESANEPLPAFTIDNADLALGAILNLQIDDGGTGYVDGTLSATGGGGSGFSGTFTVDTNGAIIDAVITNRGDYSSDPTIVIDGPQPTGANASISITGRITVVYANITNTGPIVVPVDEVWLFLDGNNAENLADISPIVDSDNIYPSDTVGIQWRNIPSNVYETIAMSTNGFNTARAVV
jgi:archaellum component FlaF (FlaF/FlaG flagellin family)